MKISEALKRFRKEFRLTQKDVADTLKMSQQSYQVYEGNSVPSAQKILDLAVAYRVSTDYLLGLSDVPRPIPASKRLALAIVECRDVIQKALAEADRELIEQSSQPSAGKDASPDATA